MFTLNIRKIKKPIKPSYLLKFSKQRIEPGLEDLVMMDEEWNDFLNRVDSAENSASDSNCMTHNHCCLSYGASIQKSMQTINQAAIRMEIRLSF
jgi:hypothetical protein